MKSLKQTFFAAVSLYSDFILGIAISLLIARTLPPAEYGIYSAAVWGAAMVTLFISSGLSLSAIKFCAQFSDEPPKLNSVNRYLLVHQLGRVGALLIAGVIFGLMTVEEVDLRMIATATVLGSGMIKADYMMKFSIFKGLERFDLNAKSVIPANIVTITSMIVATVFFASVEAFMFAFAFSSLSYWLSINRYRSYFPKAEGKLEKELAARMSKQIWAGSLVVFTGALLFRQSQVKVLEEFDLAAEAGFFNIGYLLGMAVITLVPGVYNEVLLPKITKAVANNNASQKVLLAQNYLYALCLLVVVPIAIFAEGVVVFLYGEAYQQAGIALCVLVVCRMVATLGEGANLTFISQDKQHEVASINLILLAIGVPLSIYAVMYYGYHGALVTYAIIIAIRGLVFKIRARKFGYQGIGAQRLLKYLVVSSLAALPSIYLSTQGSSLYIMLMGGISFVLIYLHLLLQFRVLDSSAAYILGVFSKKSPGPIGTYLAWGAQRLSDQPK